MGDDSIDMEDDSIDMGYLVTVPAGHGGVELRQCLVMALAGVEAEAHHPGFERVSGCGRAGGLGCGRGRCCLVVGT
jgi:hypothetical protein